MRAPTAPGEPVGGGGGPGAGVALRRRGPSSDCRGVLTSRPPASALARWVSRSVPSRCCLLEVSATANVPGWFWEPSRHRIEGAGVSKRGGRRRRESVEEEKKIS